MTYRFLFLLLILFPQSVLAAPLVACNDPLQCDYCALVATINNVIEFVITILVLVCVLLLMYAGLRLVTSTGDPSAMSEAKKMFTNVIIGFIILLAAWTIVDTLLKALLRDTDSIGRIWQPAGTEQCGRMFKPVDLKGTNFSNPTQWEDETYLNGSPLSEAGIADSGIIGPTAPSGNLVTYGGKQFDSSIVDKVQYIDQNFDLRLSGGYRDPDRNRAVGGVPNSRHLSGTAADFVGTSEQMTAAKNWANANGAKEALIHNVGSGLHLHVAW